MPARHTKDQRFWNKIAPKYAAQPIADQASYEEKLRRTRAYLSPESEVYEFGCGTGGTALLHAPHVKRIVATDIAEEMIGFGRAAAEEGGIGNVEFRQGVIEDMNPAAERFDVVLALNILHLLEDRRGALARARELLKPGGVFISSTPCLGDGLWWMAHFLTIGRMGGLVPRVKFFTRRQFLASIRASGFVIEEEWRPNDGRNVFLAARRT